MNVATLTCSSQPHWRPSPICGQLHAMVLERYATKGSTGRLLSSSSVKGLGFRDKPYTLNRSSVFPGPVRYEYPLAGLRYVKLGFIWSSGALLLAFKGSIRRHQEGLRCFSTAPTP